MNPNYATKVKEEIDSLLKAEFIAEVESSDWLFLVVVVPKKNGKLRICVDFRKLNEQTIKDTFPLLFTDTKLDQVTGHEMYSFLNGYNGYNQISLAEEEKEKTAFITEWGAFIYLVMPFRLCNAPTTFQRAMMTIFAEYLQKFMVEGDLVLWYPGNVDTRKKSLAVGWSEPYVIFRIYKNGSVKLRDPKGMLLPDQVNIGNLKKYPKNPESQEYSKEPPDEQERESQEVPDPQEASGSQKNPEGEEGKGKMQKKS
ncbi:hypothetical protein L7F22_008522 [Adiantum nelumboides]|nr:hypothetical protein [Adiantum nelumboides]